MDIDEFLDKEVPLLKEEKKEVVLKISDIGLESTFDRIYDAIKNDDLIEAEKLYSTIWKKLTEDKFTWKPGVYKEIKNVNSKLQLPLEELDKDIKIIVTKIKQLIKETKDNIGNKNKQEAIKTYGTIIKKFNDIPEHFLGEKKLLYINYLLPLYKEIVHFLELDFMNNLDSEIAFINNLIHSSKNEIQKKNYQQAARYYVETLEHFNALPLGFLIKKLAIAKKIVEVYKSLTIINKITDLRSQLDIDVKVAKKMVEPSLGSVVLPNLKKPQKFHKKYYEKPKNSIYDKIKKDLSIFTHHGERDKKVDFAGSHINELKNKIKSVKSSTNKEIFNNDNKDITKELKSELLKMKTDRAKIWIRKGRHDEARKTLSDALYLDPDNKDIKNMFDKIK